MVKKWTEKEVMSLFNKNTLIGIINGANEDNIKKMGIDILEVEPYEKTGVRYVNNRFNPIKIECGDLFTVSMTVSVDEKQAEKIAVLCKDSYIEFKNNAAVAALVAAGFSETVAQTMVKSKK